MWPTATDVAWAWFVCVSVCVSVCLLNHQNALGIWTRVAQESRNHVLSGARILSQGIKAHFFLGGGSSLMQPFVKILWSLVNRDETPQRFRLVLTVFVGFGGSLWNVQKDDLVVWAMYGRQIPCRRTHTHTHTFHPSSIFRWRCIPDAWVVGGETSKKIITVGDCSLWCRAAGRRTSRSDVFIWRRHAICLIMPRHSIAVASCWAPTFHPTLLSTASRIVRWINILTIKIKRWHDVAI